jgi:hypothetical protein
MTPKEKQERKALKKYLRKWKFQKFWKELFCSFSGHTYELNYTSKHSGHQLWYCSKCIKEKMI